MLRTLANTFLYVDSMNPQLCMKAIEKALTIEFIPLSEPSAEQPSTAAPAVNILIISYGIKLTGTGE